MLEVSGQGEYEYKGKGVSSPFRGHSKKGEVKVRRCLEKGDEMVSDDAGR